MKLALRTYRWLAEAFPHEFKLAYGREVTQLGEDIVEQVAKRHGAAGLIRLIADLAIRLPLEYLSEMRRDMRYGLRALIKSPGFALVGIISMGLGIGLTTYVYSSKWALLFRELPAVANAKNLAMAEKPVSVPYIDRFREQTNLFSGVAAVQTGIAFNVTFQGDVNAKPQRVFGQLVSAEYFDVLGVKPQRGRLLSPSLDRPGDPPVVVISDRFWQSRLNSSPDAVGRTIRLNGQMATIVGIAPKDFNGVLDNAGGNGSELFVPITVPASLAPELAGEVLHNPAAREFVAVLCLAPGVTMDAAEAGLDATTRRLDEQDSSAPARTDNSRRVTLLPAGTRAPIPRELKAVLAGFFGVMMGLIVTLACTNLANMLIARGASRRKELAIRLAVGASRFRLIRQMMSEGILLSLLGGVAGLGFAYGLLALHSQFSQPVGAPVESDLGLDPRAAAFAFVLALICGVGFSLAPALQSTRGNATRALKEGSMLRLPGYRRLGLRNLLMVAQVAGSLMLLLITGFLVIGINRTSSVQTSFDPKTMGLLSIDPVRDGYPSEKSQPLFERITERLKTVGAGRNVALAADSPFSIVDEDAAVQLTAEGIGDSSPVASVIEQTVGAGYFAVLGEQVLAGREFDEHDQHVEVGSRTSSLPLVLNETAERKLFAGESAIGRRVKDDKQSYEVVGVAHNLNSGVGIIQPLAYLPLTRRDFARPPAGGITILVRSDVAADTSAIRSEIAAIDPNLTVFNVQTLESYLARSRSSSRFAVQTYGGIGLFGLVLAAIGLAGITAYAVAQRRKEIAIRTALGATRGEVLRLVLREGTALVMVGTVLGFAGAIAMTKMLSALTSVFVEALKVGVGDPRLLVGAPVLLAAVAMLACYLPARRSTKIDPIKALREE